MKRLFHDRVIEERPEPCWVAPVVVVVFLGFCWALLTFGPAVLEVLVQGCR